MSMEIHAILPSGTAAPTRDEWQAALAELQLDLVLDAGFRPEQASGFCPMVIEGWKAGCEVDFNLETGQSLAETYPGLDTLAPDAAVMSFRFGGDMRAGACAYAAAAGLIRVCGAVLYDEMEGTLSGDADPVVATARELLAAAA